MRGGNSEGRYSKRIVSMVYVRRLLVLTFGSYGAGIFFGIRPLQTFGSYGALGKGALVRLWLCWHL